MESKIKVSVIIPAHNEERYVKRCINSIRKSANNFGRPVEIIVVCNRCTDNTEAIAKKSGAKTIINDDRCIALVRNAGIKTACGEVIMTIDCDNRMTKGTISEAYMLLKSGRYIGGGAPIRFERYSFPLWLNDIMCRIGFRLTGLHCGIFWATRDTFLSIGGFVDKRAMEDIATAHMLKSYGKKQGKKYTCLRRNFLINSTRKYDDLGDYLYFKLLFENFSTIVKALLGNKNEYDMLIDKMFYDYKH